MSLTFGRGPFGRQPGGEFNFTRQGPDVVLYWEDFPKRVRVEFNGVTVADSRRVKALHETGKFLVLYFRRQDADMERLEPSDHRTDCPHKGTASYWTVRVGDRIAENAVWSYENPVASAPFIASHLAFDFAKMDAWYQEDERVYAHPRDPYHRFDVHRSSRHVVVRHGGVVIAESDKPRILFETGTAARYYLPPEDVRTELLNRARPSPSARTREMASIGTSLSKRAGYRTRRGHSPTRSARLTCSLAFSASIPRRWRSKRMVSGSSSDRISHGRLLSLRDKPNSVMLTHGKVRSTFFHESRHDARRTKRGGRACSDCVRRR